MFEKICFNQRFVLLWMMVSIVCTVISLTVIIYSAMLFFDLTSTCVPYKCESRTINSLNVVTCLTRVIETNQTFTRCCRWYEGCTFMSCPDYETCYISNDQIFFQQCPKDTQIFLITFILGLLLTMLWMISASHSYFRLRKLSCPLGSHPEGSDREDTHPSTEISNTCLIEEHDLQIIVYKSEEK